jgi:phosphate ABC transporter phosphate-binding protein
MGRVRRVVLFGVFAAVVLVGTACLPVPSEPSGGGAVVEQSFLYGPFTLGPGDVATGSPPGGMPRPSGAFGLQSAEFDVVDDHDVPLSVHDAHLQIVMTTPARQDVICPGRAERFAVSDMEGTPVTIGSPYTYLVRESDPWGSIFRLENATAPGTPTKSLYIRYTVRYRPGATAQTARPVTPLLLDVTGCAEDPYDVPGTGGPGSVDTRSATWTAPWSGIAVAGGGHMRDGGIDITLKNETTGQIGCIGTAPYHGTPPHLASIPACVLHHQVTAGDQYRVTSRYDNSAPINQARGIFVAYVWRPPSTPVPGEPIDGAGSTWSQIAIDQWRADVARDGLVVNYQGNGSSGGRQAYIQSYADFAVSELPFQPATFDRFGNPLYDEVAAAARRPYAYLPIVGGGMSFMYHLDVDGQRVRNLELSGPTLARIFTGGIRNWNDPAIAADNDGRSFPSLPIVPVVRSDGSGTSAQFSAYLANTVPGVWNPFCTAKLGLPAPCPPTSLYPYFDGSQARDKSDGVANFVSAPSNNGSITYVEYGYALERGFPVASILNAAGYYRQPTAENVTIALTEARINLDRTQVLDDVYRNPDPRSYPVSSYSYMIVPTSTAGGFTPAKGETLGKFIHYSLCAGQQKAKRLGYAPLPPNLVQFGFDAARLIPGAPAPPPISECTNPTIPVG